LSQTYLGLHRDAQEEFHRRYNGLKGPILPVHTRNDLENIALCGEENFGKFCWWPQYRDYGKTVGFWHFNGALTDASGHDHALTYGPAGAPGYTTGICQPGATALSLDGNHYAFVADHADFNMAGEDFTIGLVFKTVAAGQQTLVSKMTGNQGYEIELTADSFLKASVGDGANLLTITGNTPLNDGHEHQATLIFQANNANGFRLLQDGEEIL